MIEALTALGAAPIGGVGPKPENGAAAASPPDFTRWLGEQLGEVGDRITTAQDGLARLATGESGDLHRIMLDLSEARLAFQLTVAVRNKVLEGYQEIMRMQI